MRWFWWFGVVPQLFLLAGYLHDLGLPPVDVSVFGALFLAWFAQVRALPMLLLALAIGRSLVDQASLPVHLLVIGVPIAVLLPLRALFVAQHWLWQAMAASVLAVVIPKLSGLCARIFDQPAPVGILDPWQVFWAASLLPPLLLVARSSPPFRAFTEQAEQARRVAA